MGDSNSDKAMAKVLKPGEKIKPEISEDMVRALAERLYGISCLEVKELNSYDDKNFKVTEDPNMKNPLITKRSPHGYVLKIMNSMDSEKLSYIEAQNEVMIYLANHHISCPRPMRNVNGHYFSLEKLSSGNHVVRLLEYQPGEIIANVPKDDFLFYQMGEYVANLDRLLKSFYHSGLVNHNHIWMVDNVPLLDNFKSAIKDPNLLNMVDTVIKEFKERVVPQIPELEKGIIHGDFNEQNIIANPKNSGKDKDWRVTAILDFGDLCISCYLFELAITMTYAMIVTGDVKTGGFVLGGYSLVRIVPEKEMKLLKLCVMARLCQSLVLGAYSHQQDPKNEYVLASQKGALKILPLLFNETDEEINSMWKNVADDYLTRSSR